MEILNLNFVKDEKKENTWVCWFFSGRIDLYKVFRAEVPGVDYWMSYVVYNDEKYSSLTYKTNPEDSVAAAIDTVNDHISNLQRLYFEIFNKTDGLNF